MDALAGFDDGRGPALYAGVSGGGLRVVEDGKLRPVGGREKDTRVVAIRYLAATNHDPHRLMAEGKLREDLYSRLSGREIVLPPLRERADDIVVLTRCFLGGDPDILTDQAARILRTPDALHPMQAAFVEHDGYQCGYCTSGQIMSAVALLKEPCIS